MLERVCWFEWLKAIVRREFLGLVVPYEVLEGATGDQAWRAYD